MVGYKSVFDAIDAYVQAAVRIEGDARPDPEPAEPREIVPYIASEMPEGMDLTVRNVTTVKPERTFWEKVLILHAMTEMTEKRSEEAKPDRPVPDLNRYSRHYYDGGYALEDQTAWTGHFALPPIQIFPPRSCSERYRYVPSATRNGCCRSTLSPCFRSRYDWPLTRQAAVALIVPRQVGKTTLALELGEETDALYLDLESREDRSEPPTLSSFSERTKTASSFSMRSIDCLRYSQELLALIDQGRRRSLRTGASLLLGSASMDLLPQSGEVSSA